MNNRANFSVSEPVVPNGPAGCVPIEAPDAELVARVRSGVATAIGAYAATAEASKAAEAADREALRALAGRLRTEHLFNGPIDYAMLRCADLDLILAFVEENA